MLELMLVRSTRCMLVISMSLDHNGSGRVPADVAVSSSGTGVARRSSSRSLGSNMNGCVSSHSSRPLTLLPPLSARLTHHIRGTSKRFVSVKVGSNCTVVSGFWLDAGVTTSQKKACKPSGATTDCNVMAGCVERNSIGTLHSLCSDPASRTEMAE